MEDKLGLMLGMQLELQQQHMKDGDPQSLTGNAMAEFMTWNFAACVKELSEATDEVGWKPWATSRHINQPQFNAEMVDAFHFFMNMLLVANPGKTPAQIADEFTKLYLAKNAVNARRQAEGYDGVSTKCPNCKRELSEVDQLQIAQRQIGNTMFRFCSVNCGIEFHKEGDHG